MRFTDLRSMFLAFLFLLIAGPAFAQAPTGFDGPQFTVNSYTTGNRTFPQVGMAPSGEFVVVWWDIGAPSDSSGVQAQRFASNGDPLGGQFLVNTYTTGGQLPTDVAFDDQGNFIISWNSTEADNGDSSGFSVQAQLYASDGAALGAQFLVNAYTTGGQLTADAAFDAAGDFVVVWQSTEDEFDSSGYSIQGRRFASDGSPVGQDFLVNAYTTGDQKNASVARSENGEFVVVWDSDITDNDTLDADVQARRFASDGSPIGDEFLVNTFTTDFQRGAKIGMASTGDFIIQFSSNGLCLNSSCVVAQRYASDGSALGSNFIVKATNGPQPAGVVVDDEGDSVFAWSASDAASGDPDGGIYARRFASDGDPVGDEFLVNTYTTGVQNSPAFAGAANGDFVVVWGDTKDVGSHYIDAQRFRVNSKLGDKVFLDADFDGVQDPSEPGIPDVQVHLFEENGTFLETALTDAQGEFVFERKIGMSGVLPDTFYLEFEAPARYAFTATDVGGDEALDSDADVFFGQTDDIDFFSGGQDNFDVDAGLTNGLGDRVWTDDNSNGLQDDGEAGLDGVVVHLYDSADQLLDTQTTAGGGFFSFSDLDAGDYYLLFEAPNGWAFTLPGAGPREDDSDADPFTGATPIIAFGDGALQTDWDAGLISQTANTDVGVTKTNNVSTVTAGGQTNYVVTATNHGTAAASGVQVTDLLPTALDCTWTSQTTGGVAGASAVGFGDLTETLLLMPGASVTYDFACDVDPGSSATLSNTVMVKIDQPDTDSGNDAAVDSDSVDINADLDLNLQFDRLGTAAGAVRTVIATVANNGPADSTGSTATAILPAGLTFSGSDDCLEDSGTVTCGFPALSPAAQASASFDVLVDGALPDASTLVIDAAIVGNESDPIPDNDDAFASVITAPVLVQVDLDNLARAVFLATEAHPVNGVALQSSENGVNLIDFFSGNTFSYNDGAFCGGLGVLLPGQGQTRGDLLGFFAADWPGGWTHDIVSIFTFPSFDIAFNPAEPALTGRLLHDLSSSNGLPAVGTDGDLVAGTPDDPILLGRWEVISAGTSTECSLFSDGFESGDTSSWSNVTP